MFGLNNDPRARDVLQLFGGMQVRPLFERISVVERVYILGSLRDAVSGKNTSLMISIGHCIGRTASVTHDYVYGFLGFASEEDRRNITVDYRRPHWDLFREVMDLWLCGEKEDEFELLGLLSFARPANDYPSWVPDLSAQSNADRHSSSYLQSPYLWRFPPIIWSSDDGEIFMPQGIYLDTVDEIHFIPQEPQGLLRRISELEDVARTVINRRTANDISPTSLLDRARKNRNLRPLFTCNAEDYRNPLPIEDSKLDSLWDAMIDTHRGSSRAPFVERGTEPQEELGGNSILNIMVRMKGYAQMAVSGRNMITTNSGFLGISVPNAQRGDVVAYWYGFGGPFLLRPGPYYYTIVGGAYIAGLMDWSLMDECLDQGLLSESTFRIR